MKPLSFIMSQPMNLRQLEIFAAVASHGSFTRAAREVHLSQPAVSAQIKHLEQSVGTALFDRLGKRVLLTEAGAVLLERAEKILAQLEQAREDMADLTGLRRGRLRLGASTTPGVYLLPWALAAFRKAHPAIHPDLTIDNTLQIEERIARNELDLGFVGGPMSRGELAEEPFLEDQLVVIAPRDHPLARKPEVALEDLLGEPFVAREPGSATWQCVDEWLRDGGLELDVTLRLTGPEAVKRAVAAGLGLSVVSGYAVAWELRERILVALDVEGFSLRRELRIIYHRDRSRSPAAAAFTASARTICGARG